MGVARRKGKGAAALGLEPRTPTFRVWCATNCTTRQILEIVPNDRETSKRGEGGWRRSEDRRRKTEDRGRRTEGGRFFPAFAGHAYAWILDFELSEGGPTTSRRLGRRRRKTEDGRQKAEGAPRRAPAFAGYADAWIRDWERWCGWGRRRRVWRGRRLGERRGGRRWCREQIRGHRGSWCEG